jgi:hypothetical protein
LGREGAVVVSGLWRDCACDDLLDNDGRPWPANPARMCRPCLIAQGGAVADGLRGTLAREQDNIVAGMTASIDQLRRVLEAARCEIEPGDDAL